MQETWDNFDARVTRETREKNLLALAVGLGADEAESRVNIEALFDMAAELQDFEYIKNFNDPNREGVEKIRSIGSWFLPKNGQSGNYSKGDGRDFAVGKRVLGLMHEPLDSESFSNLRKTVELWEPMEGLKKFDGIMRGN